MSVTFEPHYNSHSGKLIWKYRLQKWRQFVLTIFVHRINGCMEWREAVTYDPMTTMQIVMHTMLILPNKINFIKYKIAKPYIHRLKSIHWWNTMASNYLPESKKCVFLLFTVMSYETHNLQHRICTTELMLPLIVREFQLVACKRGLHGSAIYSDSYCRNTEQSNWPNNVEQGWIPSWVLEDGDATHDNGSP